jgi:hypothetical protein
MAMIIFATLQLTDLLALGRFNRTLACVGELLQQIHQSERVFALDVAQCEITIIQKLMREQSNDGLSIIFMIAVAATVDEVTDDYVPDVFDVCSHRFILI